MQFKQSLVLAAMASQAAAVAAPASELVSFAKRLDLPKQFLKAVLDPIEKREATYQCHANCGYLIYAAQACEADGSYDDCCADDSTFNNYVSGCLDCGWCLYTDYFGYLTNALSACGDPTTPTGTACASTATSLASADSSSAATTTSESSSSSTEASSSSSSSSSSSIAQETSSSAATTTDSSSSETITSTEESASSTETSSSESSSEATPEVSASSSSSTSSSSEVTIATFTGAANINVGSVAGSAFAIAAAAVALI